MLENILFFILGAVIVFVADFWATKRMLKDVKRMEEEQRYATGKLMDTLKTLKVIEEKLKPRGQNDKTNKR